MHMYNVLKQISSCGKLNWVEQDDNTMNKLGAIS